VLREEKVPSVPPIYLLTYKSNNKGDRRAKRPQKRVTPASFRVLEKEGARGHGDFLVVFNKGEENGKKEEKDKF
jgi:hypothetical protein